jgi:hypothetical protein
MSEQRESLDSPLSDAGQSRRREILGLAQAVGRRRRNRRRATIAAVIVVAILVSAAISRRRPPSGASDQLAFAHPKPAIRTPSEPIVPNGPAPITFLQSDARIIRRLSVAPQEPSWQKLSDDELLTRLAEIGQPGALTVVNGKPALVLLDPQKTPDGM